MSFQNRFNGIIESIENHISQKEDQIPERLAQESGVHLRMVADAFQFITGITLAQYIKQRRMIHALNYKMNSNCSMETAATDYGFADAPTLSKAFKANFGISPSQMSKEMLKTYMPLTIERVMATAGLKSDNDGICANEKSEILGVANEQFQIIKQVLEMNAVYGLSDKEAEYAYNLSRKYGAPLSSAFEFIEDMGLQKENGTLSACMWNVSLHEIISLCFRKNLSVSESVDEIHRLHTIGVEDVSELGDEFLEIYFSLSNTEYNFWAEEIDDFVEQMAKYGIPIKQFDDLLALGYEGSAEETIEQYKRYLKIVEEEGQRLRAE